jgi:hypothetical protein
MWAGFELAHKEVFRMLLMQRLRPALRLSWSIGVVSIAVGLFVGLWGEAHEYRAKAGTDPVGQVAFSPDDLADETVEPITAIHLSGPDSGEISTVYTYTAEIEPAVGSDPITYTWEATDQTTIINTGGISDTVAFTWYSPGTKTISVTASNEASSQTANQTVDIRNPGVVYLTLLQRGCEPIYLEDFSTPDSRWPVEDGEDVLLEFNTGEYRALVKPGNWFVAINPGLTLRAPDRLAIDLRNASGVFGSYGLLFGLAPDYSETYVFEIFPDQWYAVWYYHENSGWSLLIEGSSEYISPGSAVNHMSITFNESSSQFFVNGHYVTEIPNTPLPGKDNVGLIVFSYDFENVDVRFDNFSLEASNCYDRITNNLQSPAWPVFGDPGFMEGRR